MRTTNPIRARWAKTLTFQALFVGAVLILHALLLGRIAVINAPMFDEIAHVPSGVTHWRFGNFDLYRVNPPLMRMIATVPLLFLNPTIPLEGIPDGPYSRPEFSLRQPFLSSNGDEVFWYFTLCRWAQIPVSCLGGWICYRWSRELYGQVSGRIALLMWCFCPNVLAWGSTLTPDLGAATFGVAAGYSFWRWIKQPSWTTATIAGITLGLAELSKTIWGILFLTWPMTWIVIWIAVRCRHRQSRDVDSTAFRSESPPGALQFATILAISVYVINVGYLFESSFRPLGEFNFISNTLGGSGAHATPGNRFRNTIAEWIPVPVPANYLKGIDIQKYDFEVGKWSYLAGEHKRGGWYHYYLYAFLVKTPLGMIGLAAAALLLTIYWRQANRLDELQLVLPLLGIILIVSSQTGFNRYFRYVLPALPYLHVFASRVGIVFDSQKRSLQTASAICLLSAMLASASVFPHSHSYFNAVAGGPTGGPAHLLDANIDWGQDLLNLRRYLDQHPEIKTIGVAYFGVVPPSLAGIPDTEVPEDMGHSVHTPPIEPGWYAISVNHVYGYRRFDRSQPVYEYFRRFSPTAKAGYSIYIYHLTPDMLDRDRLTQ